MKNQIAQALLESVFYRVSALVSMGKGDRILGIKLFSTDWAVGQLCVEENAQEIWLISNHPDGDPLPYVQDVKNACSLVKTQKCAAVRLFLSSEYFSCFEAEIPQI